MASSNWFSSDPSWEICSRLSTCLALSEAVYAISSTECQQGLLDNRIKHGVTQLLYSYYCARQYLIALKPETNEVYVAFRGTEDWNALQISLKMLATANSFKGSLHGGYMQTARLIPLAPFYYLLSKYPNCKLIFTGHSLGGALAAIVTMNMLVDKRSSRTDDAIKERVFCLAFGSPSMADTVCSEYIDSLYKENFHFFVNGKDIVPSLFRNYKPFGLCYRYLKTGDSGAAILGLPDQSADANSAKKLLFTDHSIKKYIEEIHDNFISIRFEDKTAPQSSGPELSLKSIFNIPPARSWHHKTEAEDNDCYSWSVISTVLQDESKEEITLCLYGPCVTLITALKFYEREELPHHTSDECIRRFVFCVHYLPSKQERTADYYRICVVSHFGLEDLTGVFDPKRFTPSPASITNSRKRQVANLTLLELYKLAFSYCALRAHVKEMTPAATSSVRENILNCLLRCEQVLYADSEEVELEGTNGEVYWLKCELAAECDRHKITYPDKFSCDVSIENVMSKWQKNFLERYSAEPLVEIMFRLFLISQKLKKFAFAIGVRNNYVNVGRYGYQGLSDDDPKLLSRSKAYPQTLEFIAEWLGINKSDVRSGEYYLEEKISLLFWKKIEVESGDSQTILDRWDYVFPSRSHSRKKIPNKNERMSCLWIMECIDAHFHLRRLLSSECFTLAVVGPSKTGKSTLIEKMFGFQTDRGRPTEDVCSYRINDDFQVLDFPQNIKHCFPYNHRLVQAVIVVLSADTEHIDDDCCSLTKRLAIEGEVDVLYCFNQCDRLALNANVLEKWNAKQFSEFEGEKVDLVPTSTAAAVDGTCCMKNYFKERSKEWARAYKLDENKCWLTFCDLQESDRVKRCSEFQKLKSAELLTPADVKKEWLRKVLERNGLTEKSVGEIMNLRI